MSDRRCRAGKSRRSRVAGLGATAGAAVIFGVFGMMPLASLGTAPPAQADPFDVVVDSILNSVGGLDGTISTVGTDQLADPDAVSAALTGAADGAPVPSLAADITNFDQTLANAFQQYIYLPIHTAGEEWINSPLGQALDQIINAPFVALGDGGAGLDGTAPGAAAAVGGSTALVDSGGDGGAGAAADVSTAANATDPTNVTVPLQITAVTQPLVNISVSGGPSVPVTVDTGSKGLVIPWWDIGLDHLSLPTSFGFGSYSGGLGYFYLQFPETVAFQDGSGDSIATTAPTSVDAFIFGFPTSFSTLFDFPWTLEQFLAPSTASGVLGIGPDAIGPDSSHVPDVLSALPSPLNQGVLINEPAKELVFGPSPLTGGTTVQGVAQSTLYPSIDGGPAQAVHAIIDSGGVFGTMPSSVPGTGAVGSFIPIGTEISVYNQNGDLLYSYTTGPVSVTPGWNGPMVVPATVLGPDGPIPNSMNTGYIPFSQMPVYINLDGSPSTTFYNGS